MLFWRLNGSFPAVDHWPSSSSVDIPSSSPCFWDGSEARLVLAVNTEVPRPDLGLGLTPGESGLLPPLPPVAPVLALKKAIEAGFNACRAGLPPKGPGNTLGESIPGVAAVDHMPSEMPGDLSGVFGLLSVEGLDRSTTYGEGDVDCVEMCFGVKNAFGFLVVTVFVEEDDSIFDSAGFDSVDGSAVEPYLPDFASSKATAAAPELEPMLASSISE